jgi:glyoxylase-like metal-dependent hydrolase (beta-lactamase superfamily II)
MGSYVPTLLKSGDIIDLGKREIEVLPYNPCHSPTSLIYLDRTRGILFPGDEIDSGQINIWGQPVETFRDNMLSLKKRGDDFDMICPAHNGTPMHAKILDYYIENCERIMDGIEGDMDKGSTSYLLNPFESRSAESVEQRRWDPDIRRSEWKGTAINYNIHLIHNNQVK